MFGYINGFDFGEMEAMKYFAPPVSWPEDKKKDTVKSRIFSGEWYGAEKKDGYFGKLFKDDEGNVGLYSRSRGVNGKFSNKIEWVPQLNEFVEKLPNGTCLLGELYLPTQPGSKCVTTILGCLKDKALARQDKGEKINFYVFDILAWNGENYLTTCFIDRIAHLNKMKDFYLTDYVSFATYYNGEILWSNLQNYLAEGREGIVITHRSAAYEPGKRPSKTTLKVKQELKETLDVIVMGANPPTKNYSGKEIEDWTYWENSLTGEKMKGNFYRDYDLGQPIIPITKAYFNGWAGSLIIGAKKDNKVIQIGSLSGLTEEMLANWTSYVGKIFEITGMQIFDEGGIRHPKFLNVREDLTINDATWEKIFG